MIHLSQSHYRIQPWANGRGQTTELARSDDAQGMVWRLSVAAVAEDGPFSLFPGINRSLTVIRGPGFSLEGEGLSLQAGLLTPVAFPGDITIAARGVTAPSEDFNVMLRMAFPPPAVFIAEGAIPAGGLLALYAVGAADVSGRAVGQGDLVLTAGAAGVRGGPVLGVRLPAGTFPGA